MSPLTKFFVVLLVLLSIFQTAATIVFVKKTDDANANASQLQAANQQLQALADQKGNEVSNAKALADKSVINSNNQVERIRTELESTQRKVLDKDVQIAQLTSTTTLQSADLNRVTSALQTSETGKAQYQTMVADLRKGLDELVKRATDLDLTVSDLTARNDALERERRYLAEQLTEAKVSVDKLSKVLKDNQIDVASAAEPGVRGGAPAINGVVREVRDIGGSKYATISVGSADNVVKGMQFNVVDRNTGSFLGILVVDSVELNEAVGRLQGPRLTDIGPNADVRTQM